jgi:hypothetical protein
VCGRLQVEDGERGAAAWGQEALQRLAIYGAGGSGRRCLGDEVGAAAGVEVGRGLTVTRVSCSLCGGEHQRRSGASEEAATAEGALRLASGQGPHPQSPHVRRRPHLGRLQYLTFLPLSLSLTAAARTQPSLVRALPRLEMCLKAVRRFGRQLLQLQVEIRENTTAGFLHPRLASG